MADLAAKLAEADAAGARFKMIATDGVFSMDGIIADLKSICDLADRHDALVMVDDSHAVGFVGAGGRGTPEFCGVEGRVDIVTGTLGKALGGASGGYTAGRREIVELLRQRSRPYLFSNTLAPCIAAASLDVLALLQSDEGALLRNKVRANGEHFRKAMSALGFDLVPGRHPIIPVMLGDADLATRMADALLEEGIYVIGFSYPVVPKGQGAHPHADERCAHGGADRQGRRGVREGRQAAARDPLIQDGNHDESTCKARTRTRPHADAGEEAEGRPQRHHDPDPQDGDLRHRHPHLEVG